MDVNSTDSPLAFAVLLHPHPEYGGNRFHPFIASLFSQLPRNSVSAIRFDFSSADPKSARDQAVAAIDDGTSRWPGVPAVVAGYSFGAGIAARLEDDRVGAWYLLAPQVEMLKESSIRDDPRPKAVLVPEHDQFSGPDAVAAELDGWRNATISTAPGVDHFLGTVEPVVDHAVAWITSILTA